MIDLIDNYRKQNNFSGEVNINDFQNMFSRSQLCNQIYTTKEYYAA